MKFLQFATLMCLFSFHMMAQNKVPLKDFFRNPEKSYFTVSPNGKMLAFTQPWEDRMNVYVQKIDGGGEPIRVTSLKDRDIAGYAWKSNDKILYVRDFGGDENFHLFSVTTDGKDEKDLTPFEGVRVELIDDLEENATDVLVGMNKRNPQIYDVYRLNTATGDMKMVAENPGNITSWLTDHDGNIRVANATDGVNNTLLYREKEGEPFKEIRTTNFKENLAPLFFTFDNKNLYAASNIGRDKTAIVEIDPRSGKELKLIFDHKDVDVSGMDYSKIRKVLTTVNYTTWKDEIHFLDDKTRNLYEELRKQFKGYEVYIGSTSRQEDVMVVRIYNDRNIGGYYLYNANTSDLKKIADRNPWLKEEDMTSMNPIVFTSRDGLTINGYLTLPLGKAPKNLPVVINPHGGPWARDQWGFNPEVQFLANRGYAVLQINFRGSTGYGRKFWEASFDQWGLKMQDDITDGVKWLIEQGIADPKRIAIYGGSYGGYATLAGLTFTPDLYACGVDYVGVSNMFTFMNTIPPYWEPFRDMFYEMVGDPEKDKERLAKVSPALHADQIKAPLLVAQGAKDPRVNKAESDQMVEALRKRGVDVEYIVKENEGHGFHNEENRFEFYEAMERFLSKHLQP